MRNYENFGDIKNVFAYMDDLLITGRTRNEHDEALLKVLERARAKCVRFNPKKMQIAVMEVNYLGHTFSENEIAPDANKITAIKEMGQPKDKTDLRKFLGVVNHVRSFVNNMSKLTAPLRELTKHNVIFNWTSRHTETFETIKQSIVNAPILVPFDENKDIRIQCDASKDGLGCCILQDKGPISFASRK